MREVIDLSVLSSVQLQRAPFPWAVYEGTFKQEPASVTVLTKGFKCHSQRRILEAIGKKGCDAWFQHNVETSPLLGMGERQPHEPTELDDVWLSVAENLLASDIVNASAP
jgi:hypothetical protein